jgi:hypothetical protein
MSIGEVLVVVRSMNGGRASGDSDVLGVVISEMQRIGTELVGDFGTPGAKGLGAQACRDEGYALGWNVDARANWTVVGRDSTTTAGRIVEATGGREAELVNLKGFAATSLGQLQLATVRAYLEQMMNSTYTDPITGVNVSTERGLDDADVVPVYPASYATAGGDYPSGSATPTSVTPTRTSPVTQAVSDNATTTTSGSAPVSTERQTDTRDTHTQTMPNTTTTTSSNVTPNTTDTTTRPVDTTTGTDPTVTAARDTTSPTTSPSNAAPNTTGPQTPGPNTTGPNMTGSGNRSLNLSTPLSLPGLNTPTGAPGSPTPRTINGPISSGGPRTPITPRTAGPLSTPTGTTPTSTVPGTTRPIPGGAVPSGARSAGAGGDQHTVAGYLRTEGNGAQMLGPLPLVSPPVLGDWSIGPETVEPEDDSGSDRRDH